MLSFYDAGHRTLPWRASNDPYHVLVSEIMLQQTRAETVIPYYQRWLARFPDVHSLAGARSDDVLRLWEGLGYYTRARNLHRAAQMVRERYDGSIPGDYHALKALPGVGDYTAAAVASIGFGAPHAAVDGNVRRVLCRVLDLETAPPAELQGYADKLLDRSRPGDFNQAMMELGATICTPRSPCCRTCPVKELCRARRNDTVSQRPAVKRKGELPHEEVNTLVAINRGEVLVAQRPANGLLAGLWEFPETRRTEHCVHVADVTHTFTHKRITYRVFRTERRVRAGARAQWLPVEALETLPMPRAQRKIAALIFD